MTTPADDAELVMGWRRFAVVHLPDVPPWMLETCETLLRSPEAWEGPRPFPEASLSAEAQP